ncbi:hypothetical protein RE628_21885 [Paenibacillus sp. D2_2]|nr:hypothetical protein [Paenibacillus sp. D2_2]WMT39964.1 hypothetical protein RE628_21885 [Paenibacillus sp. D2_2]
MSQPLEFEGNYLAAVQMMIFMQRIDRWEVAGSKSGDGRGTHEAPKNE